MSLLSRFAPVGAVLTLAAVVAHAVGAEDPPQRWWKGNTHTHTLWSDGDGAPDLVVDWYRARGYAFLALTDHNQLQEEERWFPIKDGTRLDDARVAALRARFGAARVDVGERGLRLATLDALRKDFEAPGQFLLVKAEEVTASYREVGEAGARARDYPVHINALNIDALVPPRGSTSPAALMNAALAAIRAEGERAQKPVVAHVNHPNFKWGLDWEDLATIEGLGFFEVYNGHRGTQLDGDETRPSTERIWDLALTRRLGAGGELLYGVATDDAHDYHGGATSRPGRGWIQVRARTLAGDALMQAMLAGDFYASSGVTLEDVALDTAAYTVDVLEPGCTVEFIGARKGGEPGALLASTTEDPAVYRFGGDELYVRARVTSQVLHSDPNVEGEPQRAWTQPVRGPWRPRAGR
ncbi:MAG: hypothetical protein R3F49_09610 [Planctomycetota bacterium]